MSDIDILVPPSHLSLMESVLRESGYSEVKNKKWYGNKYKSEWNRIVEGDELTVEIHTDLFYGLNLEKTGPHFCLC